MRLVRPLAGMLAAIFGVPLFGGAASPSPADWRADWAVEKGFALSLDSQGYQMPTAIAFVPRPGPGPKDPLYFVTELRGTVKVVTNDRTVATFARVGFSLQPLEELPAFEGETGLAGICLAERQGYVFVTFAYRDREGFLRNNIVRYQTRPGTFSTGPAAEAAFTRVFEGFETSPSHQIGACQVAGEALYVGVGDGKQTRQSQQLASLLGKVLRLTLEGEPLPDSPFAPKGERESPASYVWAYGFRNPFGLALAGDRLFVADNGPSVDRIVEVRGGMNALWDGSDQSVASLADLVLVPGEGAAQLEHCPPGFEAFPPPYRDSFFLAVTGNMQSPAERTKAVPHILSFRLGSERGRPAATPRTFLRYRGEAVQILAGLALGPDGLYFAPLIPGPSGTSPVVKITYDPPHEHPYATSEPPRPAVLMEERGCFGCHTVGGLGRGNVGPPLDRDALVQRLSARLSSREYLERLRQIDGLDREPFASYRAARARVREAQGLDRLRLWLDYMVQEPRFDRTDSPMPNLGVTPEEARLIANFLLQEPTRGDAAPRGPLARIKDAIFPVRPSRKNLASFFAAGFLAAVALVGLLSALAGGRRRIDTPPGRSQN